MKTVPTVKCVIRRDRVAEIYLEPAGRFGIVQVGLESCRAADPIRIVYDFDRDGYVIQQSPDYGHSLIDKDPTWIEVAFIKSWALETPDPSVRT